MIARWPTGRCLQEDVPGLTQTGHIVRGFLAEQDPTPSGDEPFEGRTRPDTFTFHAREGRGAVWQDHTRAVLWLCCTDDRHDRGYAHGHDLAADGRLYPDLAADFVDGVAAAPWGAHLDDDRLESLRFSDAALTAFAGGTTLDSPCDFVSAVGFIRLGIDEEGIWTLTVRRTLVYPDAAAHRARFLRDEELEALFAELTGQAPDDAEFWAPPHEHLFINIHFLGGPLTPTRWLEERIAAAFDGQPECALRAT